MAARAVEICRAGMITAVGLGAAQTFTSTEAGVAGFQDSSVQDAAFQPVVMATVPEEALPPLADEVENAEGLTGRQRRLLRLATPVFAEVMSGLSEARQLDGMPIFLATPEKHPDLAEPVAASFLEHLVAQFEAGGLTVEPDSISLIPKGRAGGLIALQMAQDYLNSGGGDYALAGGVDSYFDLMLLATLDKDQRIQSSRVMDGFIPGEGAGLLLLKRTGAPPLPGVEPLARLMGVGRAKEPGHRYSEEPYRGDGLAEAFHKVLSAPGVLPSPVQTIFAGLTGESFGAKEYGVASLRSSQHLLPDARVSHPVDCFGDIGAALGPVMAGLAAMGVQTGSQGAPALVWCSSEGADRAAAVINPLAG